jgi:hypothetical protein
MSRPLGPLHKAMGEERHGYVDPVFSNPVERSMLTWADSEIYPASWSGELVMRPCTIKIELRSVKLVCIFEGIAHQCYLHIRVMNEFLRTAYKELLRRRE